MDVAHGKIGSEGAYDLKIENGQVQISLAYSGAEMGASVSISMPIKAYLDKLASAIPGEIDDAVIKALESAMGI